MIVMTIEREWQDGIRFQKNVDKMQSTIYVDLISLGLRSVKLWNTKLYWVKLRILISLLFTRFKHENQMLL